MGNLAEDGVELLRGQPSVEQTDPLKSHHSLGDDLRRGLGNIGLNPKLV